MNTITNLSIQQLRQIANLKEQAEALEKQIIEIAGSSEKAATKPGPKGKRKMSASARAKIAAAQKARWAKQKEVTQTVKTAPKPAKKKGGMSAAGRARIVAAQKARWAAIKAAKKAVVKPASVAKSVPATKPAKKKFTMSAAAKAKISAAAKARWAKIRAAKAGKK